MDFFEKLIGLKRKKDLATYQRGIRYFNELEYEHAIQAFERVLSEKSVAKSLEANLAKFYCGRAYINVGITEFARNNNKKALAYFEKAKKFNPQDTDLDYFIGICLNNIGRFQEAMSSFSKILETEPWNIPTKLKIAITFHNMKMWKNAEEIHRAILKEHPDFADVHYHLGLSLMSQSKPKEASQSFSRALNINPNYTQARLKLAMVHICLDQIDKAEKNLNQILNRHSEYADVYYLLALVKEKKHDLSGAAYHLTQALDISPEFKNALVKKIIIHYKLGERSEANTLIEKALQYYPQDKRISAIHKAFKVFAPEFSQPEGQKDAINLEEEDLIKELRNEFHKDLDIMPNVSEIISMFSNSKYADKEDNFIEFLLPFITEQINRNPTYPDLYNSLGTQLLSAKKHLEAENAFSKALELNPNYITARVNLMKVLYQSGKYEDALVHGKYLVSKEMPFADVYFTLAKIQVQLKLYEEALINAKQVQHLKPEMNENRLLLAEIHIGMDHGKTAAEMLKAYLEGPADPKNKQLARKMLSNLEKSGESF